MISRLCLTLALPAFFSITLAAQDTIHFREALVANTASQYGREAVYTDPLAHAIYTGALKTPAAGAQVFNTGNADSVVWTELAADSLNRLINRTGPRGRGFFRGGSYMYLTHTASRSQSALLNVQGAASVYVNGELHATDPYGSGWLYIPINLRKGLNEFYIRGAFVRAKLCFPDKPVFINTADSTLPHVIIGQNNDSLRGAVVIVNASTKSLSGLSIRSTVEGREITSSVPDVLPMSVRKVPFTFNAGAIGQKGSYSATLTLLAGNKAIDNKEILIEAVDSHEQYSATFVSDIDGSLQYYAVAPQKSSSPNSALFLSVHGAGVEAIGQARAYKPKDWGTLVAATNRRPRGFNWEDWGRLDALEVLTIAKEKFRPDPSKVYLTGHSMGGHGTWFLGATYPDKWAAIAPCAGYPTLKGYGSADGLIPDSAADNTGQMLLRSSNQSDVIKLARNYKGLGVYIFHGDSDRVVSVDYARQMRNILGDFHPDMSYYEYPGGEHWFGDISVDWQPIFDFFKWHKKPADSSVDIIDFTTASPGISSKYYWTGIIQQHQPLQYSRLQLTRDKKTKVISGTVENVRLLQFALAEFGSGATVKFELDSTAPVTFTTRSHSDTVYLLNQDGKWTVAGKPALTEKGPHRYGTFKDAFNHRMVFVYGTAGSKAENAWSLAKARYDAETWYYRGNGAVDIIADRDYNAAEYKDRGVIIYGNRNTNAAYQKLLEGCPIQIERNRITAGADTWEGDDLAAYYVWPLKDSEKASVGVVAGTGLKGMNAANANQYFAGASGFPDFMVYRMSMLIEGVNSVKLAGFFNHNWKLGSTNTVTHK